MRRLGFETEHVIARPVVPGDRANCLQALDESELTPREAVGDFLTVSQTAPARFERMIVRRARWVTEDRHYLLGLFLKDSGRFIGDTMLFNVDRTMFARAEIGLAICSCYQGLGYGSGCLSGTIKWGLGAQVGLHEVYGNIEDGNLASTVACLRAGFQLSTSVPVSRRSDGEMRLFWPIAARSLP